MVDVRTARFLKSSDVSFREWLVMGSDDFAERVAGVAALADPIRRELYLFVAAQPEPVSRDQAAEGVGVPRHTAKFHLDKLVEQGLLDTEFRRLSGRRGPGAGRPTKLYRRSGRELSVTLPERRYDLAGQLLASAIDDSTRTGTPVLDALHTAAAELRPHPRRPGSARPRPTTRAGATGHRGLRRPDRPRVRTPSRGRDHHPGQLPLRRPGPGPHRTGLRDEPRAARRGRRPGR